MTLWGFLKKFSIIIIALIALFLTRMGISYLIILIGIGIITPILSGNKKDAILSGILYATLSYLISYPSGLFLINFMPSESIPVSTSFLEVIVNLIIGWLVPVLITIILVGISSFIGEWIAEKLNKNKTDEREFNPDNYYFEDEEDMIQIEHEENTDYQKKDLLSLNSIQKAKNRKNREKDW